MTDTRPANCKFRLRDEGKPHPRSWCAACGKGILTGLGRECPITKEQIANSEKFRAALVRIAEMKPHHAGQTVNEYHMQQIATEALGGTEYTRADIATTDARVMAHPKVVALVESLRELLWAVCGDTGFAVCIRTDTGRAYPWPALDAAEASARAALRELESSND